MQVHIHIPGNYSINDPIQFTNTATGDYVRMLWDLVTALFYGILIQYIPLSIRNIVTQTVTYPFGCIYVQKITFIVEKDIYW
jgi:uncharacterized membrane protein